MIKIIELEIDPELSGETGVFEVALVEYPAIEQDFVYFGRQKFYKAPQDVAAKACRAIKENEERGNPAATQVGKIRAQQLCNRDEVSLETIKRMKSYLERAATYYTGNYDDNGTISYDLWGGKPALEWVDRILSGISAEMAEDLEDACWEGYIAVGLKPAADGSGRMVPNCVPEESFEKFVYPTGSESENEFISRCIGDDKMTGEFPDESQRTAVCYSYWERRNEFARDKVSFDWDGTLTTSRGIRALENELRRGSEIYIISARSRFSEDINSLVRKYRINPVNVFLTGNNPAKVNKIKALGIARHYDNNATVRRELGTVGVNFDYDVSALPVYENTTGSTDNMLVKPKLNPVLFEQDCGCFDRNPLDIFGYKTENYDICPGAIALFKHLVTMPVDQDTIGMIRSAAVVADKIFGIEKSVLEKGMATMDDLNQVIVLVDDFKDIIAEVDKIVGMTHDTSFMDGHIEVVRNYLNGSNEVEEDFELVGFLNGRPIFSTEEEAVEYAKTEGCDNPQIMEDQNGNKLYLGCGLDLEYDFSEYSSEELEAVKLLGELAQSHPEKFEAVIPSLVQGVNAAEIVATNYQRPTKFYRYVRKKFDTVTDENRDFCMSIEGFYFRRFAIDAMRDYNREFGHNRQGYSKWLWKGGPNCIHGWEEWEAQGRNFRPTGRGLGQAGEAPANLPNQGYYSEETKRKSQKAYWAQRNQNMSKQEFVGDLQPLGYLEDYPIYSDLVTCQDASYMMGCGGTYEEVMYEGKKAFKACNSKAQMAEVEKQIFSTDEEQRMIYTPLMIPNLLIPRVGEDGERYFVKFTPKAVETIQRKFMIQQRTNKTNLEHTDIKFDSVIMVESWIVNGESDKAYTLGFTREQVPTGTWMGGYKILETPEGDVIWNDLIKTGVVKGVSVEGNFILNFSRNQQDEYLLTQIINILKKIRE